MRKKKVKILFVANNTVGENAFSGGDNIYVSFLKNWSNDIKITLFGSEEARNISKKAGVGGVDYIVVSRKRDVSSPEKFLTVGSLLKNTLIRTIDGVKYVLKNNKLLRKHNYVYSVSDFYPDLIPALLIKLFNKKIKWVAGYYLIIPPPWDPETPYKFDRFKGLLYWIMQIPSRFVVKYFADCVLVTSQPDVSVFVTKKRDKSKVVVVRGGVDITESEKYLSGKKIIPVFKRKYDACFLGRFHPQKGVLELIDIWKLIVERKPTAKLAMIGGGELFSQVQKKIIKLGLKKNIDLLGTLGGEKKYAVFKNSKLMVHPAIFDSGGMAAAEGMAWELPGVSFDLEALKTYYPKGMLKVEEGKVRKFAKTVLKLIDEDVLYSKTAKKARELVLEKWVWEKRTDEVYLKAFGNG